MKFNELDTLDFDETAPLAPRISGPREAPGHIDFWACSHLGNVRRNNEDHYAVIRRTRSRKVLFTNMPRDDLSLPDDDSYVLVVADGMGGAAFGQLASRLALKTADELVGSACGWITKLQDVNFPPIQDRIQAYADLIHETLVDYGHSDPRLAGMGTTLTCAHALGSDVIIAHVGDSRAYHFRAGNVAQVTRDQTLAQDMMDAGMPAGDTVRFRHILTNCLGGDARAVRCETHHLRLQDGDALLLCTDGLTDLIGNHEIAPVLDACVTAQDACDQLLQMALGRGGRDNITVVLGRFLTVAAAASIKSL